MPWRPALLKGNRVLARCDEHGAFLDEGGRVEVRYRPTDPRAYRAGVRNLSPVAGEVLPDEHCVPAAPEGAQPSAAKAPAGARARTAKAGSGADSGGAAPGGASSAQARFTAYTDGACSGNPGPAGLGVVLLDGPRRTELSEYLGSGTNNVAELTAILRALEAIAVLLAGETARSDGLLAGGTARSDAPDESVLIHTDSQYAIGVLQKGWKPKVNQALIAAIKERMQAFRKLRLVYVPGHAGVPLNERADELARAAVSSRSSPGWREVEAGREPARA